MTDYSKGKIYQIKSENTDLVYIGSTVNSLKQRLGEHWCANKMFYESKGFYKTSFDVLDYGLVSIHLLEEVNATSKEELLAREGYYIRNNKCVNLNIPGRTDQQYRKDNREYKRGYDRKYRQENRERLREYRIKYYQEYYQEKGSLTITCVCGATVTNGNLIRHYNTKKHQAYINLKK